MKNVVEQLSNYKSVHLNKNNVKTHFIGIPLIIWAVALLLSTISFEISFDNFSLPFTLAAAIASLICIYYFILKPALAVMVIICFFPIFYSADIVASLEYTYVISFAVFVIGWILQFIGHAYEKAKPAFVDDLNQLLIGPLFLIAEIYFFLGIDKVFEKEVHEKAIEKRKLFELNKQTS